MPCADDGRDETEAERLDRNWAEILQELRVVQTGTQILTGFLLTLVFQQRFTELDPYQVEIYLDPGRALRTRDGARADPGEPASRPVPSAREAADRAASRNVILELTLVVVGLTLDRHDPPRLRRRRRHRRRGSSPGSVTLVLAALAWALLPAFARRPRAESSALSFAAYCVVL